MSHTGLPLFCISFSFVISLSHRTTSFPSMPTLSRTLPPWSMFFSSSSWLLLVLYMFFLVPFLLYKYSVLSSHLMYLRLFTLFLRIHPSIRRLQSLPFACPSKALWTRQPLTSKKSPSLCNHFPSSYQPDLRCLVLHPSVRFKHSSVWFSSPFPNSCRRSKSITPTSFHSSSCHVWSLHCRICCPPSGKWHHLFFPLIPFFKELQVN
jgi:hypothetical protein